jgi:flagellum-specific peptidoglycan hydrolase FlgJ
MNIELNISTMAKQFLFVSTLLLFTRTLQAAQSLPEKYVDQWKSTAVSQMLEHKIPASITLAQGILESGSGTSMLATQAKNHFGIKCHDWQGEKIYKDDDKKNECFRVYPTADQSFNDHSAFLTGRGRYSSLFELDLTDYKSWAKGLKKAGYATSSTYAIRLIDIIEKYELSQYDELRLRAPEIKSDSVKSKANPASVVNLNVQHAVQKNNKRVKYIVAKSGDTYYRIAKEFGLGLWQLYKYNDCLASKDMLAEGEKVYLQPKVSRSKDQSTYIVKTSGETMISISQETGVKLKSVLKRNPSNMKNAELSIGTVIRLK